MAGEAGDPGEGLGHIDIEVDLPPVGPDQIVGAA
jgi:hypothetical protein